MGYLLVAWHGWRSPRQSSSYYRAPEWLQHSIVRYVNKISQKLSLRLLNSTRAGNQPVWRDRDVPPHCRICCNFPYTYACGLLGNAPSSRGGLGAIFCCGKTSPRLRELLPQLATSNHLTTTCGRTRRAEWDFLPFFSRVMGRES